MEFKKVLSWVSDEMPETTPAVVVVSSCGSMVKRLPYKSWCKLNKSYSSYKEHIYSFSENRGKQRLKKESSRGKYKSCFINGKSRYLHRLVAMAWVPNKGNKPHVNHKDGNKNNNHCSNLEWVTNSENMAHAIECGLSDRSKSLMSHVKDKGMEMLSMRLGGMCTKEVAVIYGVSHETVRKYTLLAATESEKKELKKIESQIRWKNRRANRV